MRTTGLPKIQYDDSWQYQAEPKPPIFTNRKEGKSRKIRVTPLVRNLRKYRNMLYIMIDTIFDEIEK